MIGFALVLLLGSAATWIAAAGARLRARAYFRLAAVLYAAMALASGFATAEPAISAAVTDIVMPLGAAVLVIGAYAGFRRRPVILSASLILAGAGLAGIASAMLGLLVLAAVPQVLATLFALLIARKHLFTGQRSGIYLALGGLCLMGAAACRFALGTGPFTQAGLLVFAAAGQVGIALASNLIVEEERFDRGWPSVH